MPGSLLLLKRSLNSVQRRSLAYARTLSSESPAVVSSSSSSFSSSSPSSLSPPSPGSSSFTENSESPQQSRPVSPSPAKRGATSGGSNGHLPPVLRRKPRAQELRVGQVIGDRFEVGPIIGRGRFGVVRLGVDLQNSEEHVALKCMSKNVDARVVDNELQVLGRLMELNKEQEDLEVWRHCTVPLEMMQVNDQHVIAMEYLWGGDLFDRIMLKGFVEEKDLRPVLRCLLHSLKMLHSNGIVHRDIKPENVLFRVKGKPSSRDSPMPRDKVAVEEWALLEPVLCDFGLSHVEGKPDQIEAPAGTFGYASPQMLNLEKRYSQACDVWSLGVLMFACLGGELPFPASTDGTTSMEAHLGEAYRGPRFLSSRWASVSAEAKELIGDMLHYSPYNRIRLDHVLDHPWFSMTP